MASRRAIGAFCVLAGLVPLQAAAWLAHGAGLAPCPLCLWERWPFRALMALGLVGVALPRAFGRTVAFLAVPACLAGLGLAMAHVGVERHWWISPLSACRIAPGVLPALPLPACDRPARPWTRLPVTLAEMAAGAHILILAALAWWLRRNAKEEAHAPSAPARRPVGPQAPGADDQGGSRG